MNKFTFYHAWYNNNVFLVKLHLDNEESVVNPDAILNRAIRACSARGYDKIVELLLNEPNVDPSAQDNEAIRKACENGHTKIVALLLNNKRVNPTIYHNMPLRKACQNGHIAIVELLLKNNQVDPTDMQNQALYLAKQNGHDEIVKLLLNQNKSDQKNIKIPTAWTRADMSPRTSKLLQTKEKQQLFESNRSKSLANVKLHGTSTRNRSNSSTARDFLKRKFRKK